MTPFHTSHCPSSMYSLRGEGAAGGPAAAVECAGRRAGAAAAAAACPRAATLALSPLEGELRDERHVGWLPLLVAAEGLLDFELRQRALRLCEVGAEVFAVQAGVLGGSRLCLGQREAAGRASARRSAGQPGGRRARARARVGQQQPYQGTGARQHHRQVQCPPPHFNGQLLQRAPAALAGVGGQGEQRL